MIQITVDTRQAVVTNRELLTSGSNGIGVQFLLSEDWEGLVKTAAFRCDDDETSQIDIAITDSHECVVPWETLAVPERVLFAGIYGTDGNGNIIIPTIWVSLGVVRIGVRPGTADGPAPTPDMWAQIQQIAETAGAANAEAAHQSEIAAAASASQAGSSATAADGSASAAATSASQAAVSATNAANSAGTASTKATEAAASASSAADASAAATGAKNAAQTAKAGAETAANNASSFASSAQSSAVTAATRAQEAASSASSAATSASTASTKATQASTSATNAANSATAAAGSATTASTKAGEAATSATNAGNSATAAANAKTAAETAQGKAETAQGKAEDAQTAAEAAAAEAVSTLAATVKVTEQTFTTAEQAQARENITAADGNIFQNSNDATAAFRVTDEGEAVAQTSIGLQNGASAISLTIDELMALKAAAAEAKTDLLHTFTDEIVQFNAKVELPLQKLEAAFTPIQNLNGQEAPYPPGGGKNKLETTLTTETSRGITATVNADGSIVLSGTNDGTSYSSFKVNAGFQTENGVEYILSGGFSENIFLRDVAASKNDTGSGVTITGDGNAHEIDIRILVNTAITGTVVIKPMIRLSSVSDATFAPYSNICPISGHDGCEIVRDGKNLLDPSTVGQGAISGVTGLPYADNRRVYTDFIKIDGSAFSVSNSANMQATPVYYDKDEKVITNGSWTNCPASFSPLSSAMYVRLVFRLSTDAQITPSDLTNPQCELGSTASDYEAYQGTTVTVSFGQTVYGCTLTVNEDGSGQIVAEYATESWKLSTFSGSSSLGSYTRAYHNLSNMCPSENPTDVCNVAPFATGWASDSLHFYCYLTSNNTPRVAVFLPNGTDGDTDIQVCYKLATPITIPLTPGQINTLVGTNTVWVNNATGDITVQAYGTEIS